MHVETWVGKSRSDLTRHIQRERAGFSLLWKMGSGGWLIPCATYVKRPRVTQGKALGA